MNLSQGQPTLGDVAPRLAKAHRAEKLYQERRRHQRVHGYLSMEIAAEEMVRSMRVMMRSFTKTFAAMADGLKPKGDHG